MNPVNVTPFTLLKRSTALAMAERASTALSQWGALWAALPDHAVTCVAASDAAPLADTRRRQLANGASVWVALPAGIERLIEQSLFGLADMGAASDKHLASRLGTDVASEALEALLSALVQALAGQSSAPADGAATPPQKLARRGSGAVVCNVVLGERAIRVLLGADVLPAAPVLKKRGDGAPLATLHQALGKLPVHLNVEVCRTELTLGYLGTLAVGDVLTLPMAIDQEMLVTGPGGTVVCHAHLGAVEGSYAVELIKAKR